MVANPSVAPKETHTTQESTEALPKSNYASQRGSGETAQPCVDTVAPHYLRVQKPTCCRCTRLKEDTDHYDLSYSWQNTGPPNPRGLRRAASSLQGLIPKEASRSSSLPAATLFTEGIPSGHQGQRAMGEAAGSRNPGRTPPCRNFALHKTVTLFYRSNCCCLKVLRAAWLEQPRQACPLAPASQGEALAHAVTLSPAGATGTFHTRSPSQEDAASTGTCLETGSRGQEVNH